MRITGVKSFLVNPGDRVDWGSGFGANWHFVKVYTDEGLDGLGEVFHSVDEPAEAALRKFERWLIGKDPTKIIHNWQAIYRGLRYPLGTATLSALSAVEQALWDIAGKACGLPICRMLGGPCRDRIQVYASAGLLSGKPLVEAALDVVSEGYGALKFTPQPPDYASKSAERVFVESVERVRSVREAVGDEIAVCLDYHGRSFSPAEAVRFAEAVGPFHPLFLEEPAPTENPRALAEIRSKTNVPVAGGERCISRQSFREILETRAVDIFQPEPLACGGILETVKWAATAELHHIMIAPHQACSPVSLLVCAHIDACIPNFLIQECNVRLDSPSARDMIVGLPEIAGGYLQVPSKPGLGIELNEESLADYPYRPFDRPVMVMQDGSIGLE